MSSLYILDINSSDGWFPTIFSHSVDCLYILLIVPFAVQKPLYLFQSPSSEQRDLTLEKPNFLLFSDQL